jgi:hypothetical protein
MPILKGTGNTLPCASFGYGKRISTFNPQLFHGTTAR